jgi:hypothetical protein
MVSLDGRTNFASGSFRTNGLGTNGLSGQLAQRNGRGGQRDRNSQQTGGDQQSEQNGDQQGQGQGGRGERQVAENSNQQGQQGQSGEQGQGQQQGQQNGQAGQQGQQGQPGQQGQQGRNGQQASNGQQSGDQQNSGANQGQRNLAGGGRQNFFDGGYNNGGYTGGYFEEGPITGGDFRTWADQLRDVQEMIDAPDLRNQLAQVLDRARALRAQYVRHSEGPKWDFVQNNVLNPLIEVRQRVTEELARRDASQVAPLDRDPVPGRYAELVSRYYQSLGQGAPVAPKSPPTQQ